MKKFKLMPRKASRPQAAFEIPDDYFEFSKQVIIQRTVYGQTLPNDYFATLPEAILAKKEEKKFIGFPWYFPASAAAIICLGLSFGIWQQESKVLLNNKAPDMEAVASAHITEYLLNEHASSSYMGNLEDDLMHENLSSNAAISFNTLIEQTDSEDINSYILFQNDDLSLDDYAN